MPAAKEHACFDIRLCWMYAVLNGGLLNLYACFLWKNTCLSVSYAGLLSTDKFQTPLGEEPESSL